METNNKWNITEAGTYSITIDVASKRVTITKPARNAPTGISTVDSSDEAPAEYFTLNGIKVTNPSSGIYIKRQGGKTTKVFCEIRITFWTYIQAPLISL